MAKKTPTAAAPAAAATPPAPAKDKAAKFRELATKRVSRTVHAIRLIANLANRSSYEYTDEQSAKLMTALAEAVDYVGNAFLKSTAKAKDTIQF